MSLKDILKVKYKLSPTISIVKYIGSQKQDGSGLDLRAIFEPTTT